MEGFRVSLFAGAVLGSGSLLLLHILIYRGSRGLDACALVKELAVDSNSYIKER